MGFYIWPRELFHPVVYYRLSPLGRGRMCSNKKIKRCCSFQFVVPANDFGLFFFFNLPPSNYACPRIVYWISDGHSPFLLKNKIFKNTIIIHVDSVGVELDVVWTVRSFTRFCLQQLWRDVVQMLRNDPALFDTWATVCPNDEMIFETPFAKIICGPQKSPTIRHFIWTNFRLLCHWMAVKQANTKFP